MQILIDRLERPWGIEQQIGYVARTRILNDRDVTIYTRSFNEESFRDLKNHVEVSSTPWKQIGGDRTTLCGPYPATKWIDKSPVNDYSILLSEIPWGLYPSKQEQWLGTIPGYVTGNSQLIRESFKYIVNTPVRKTRRIYNRYRHERAIDRAEQLYVYDNRLEQPVNALHDRDVTLIPPITPEPRENNQTPRSYFLSIAPLEPDRNLHLVIDAFYLLVRRYGARFQPNWESDSPFQSGALQDFQLKIVGEGPGKQYLKDYAETQQLDESVNFEPWFPPEKMERTIHTSLAVIDVPLTGDASVVPYQALAGGVPTVYSRSHPGLDSLAEQSELAKQVKPSAKDEIAKFMMNAAKIPPTQRQPVPQMAESLSPEHNIQSITTS